MQKGDRVTSFLTTGLPRYNSWNIEISSPGAPPEEVRDLLDASHEEIRRSALGLVDEVERFARSSTLWSAMAESPYPDLQQGLIARLSDRDGVALDDAACRHLWTATGRGSSWASRSGMISGA